MKGEVYKLTTGALLHDVGKIVYRCGDGRSHAESGYAFLKENAAKVKPYCLPAPQRRAARSSLFTGAATAGPTMNPWRRACAVDCH